MTDSSSNCLDSINILESQLDNLFSEVKTLLRLGKENEAIDLLQANYEAVKEQLDAGSRGIEEAAILNVIALGYMALGDEAVVGSILSMVSEFGNKEFRFFPSGGGGDLYLISFCFLPSSLFFSPNILK